MSLPATHLGSPSEKSYMHKFGCRITRTVSTAALVVATVTLPGAAAQSAPRPAPGAGTGDAFVRVADLGTQVASSNAVAMTAPAKNVVFIASAGPDGNAVVTRITRRGDGTIGRTSYQLSSPAGSSYYERLVIDGTSASDVWLTAGGQLWRFDGRRFLQVKLPQGVSSAATVTDVPGRSVYAGVSTATGGAVLHGQVRGGQVRWQSLGGAERSAGYTYSVEAVRVASGRVFAMFSVQQSALLSRQAYEYGQGTWTRRFQASQQHSSSGTTRYAWLAPKAGNQLVLGNYQDYNQRSSPYCLSWTGGKEARCTTGSDSGVAAALADGRIVTGGFAIRDRAGTETRLAGETGSATRALAAERGSNTAWALNVIGDRAILQRFAG